MVTIYAWVKDAAGNISEPKTTSVLVALDPDTQKPVITSFTADSHTTTTSVPVTSFTATDNVGVTGYVVRSVPDPFDPAAPNWSATPPTVCYLPAENGPVTIYAWVKDAAGNVSEPKTTMVTITLPVDTQKPVVTSFSIESYVMTPAIPILSFTAQDNRNIAGYFVSSQPDTPSLTDTGWSITPQKSYPSPITKGDTRLYAWVKDGAGNISERRYAATTVNISESGDVKRPVITSFTLPAYVVTRTIPIRSFTATDDMGVTGYCVWSSGDTCKWTSTPPKSYKPLARHSGEVLLMARVIDAAGNISDTASATVKGVPQAYAPDLVITQVVHPAQTVTLSERTFKVTDTITNQGMATAPASNTKYKLYWVYRSTQSNGMWTEFREEYDVTGTRYVPSLRPGQSSTGTATLTVPASVKARTFQIKVWADRDNVVDELNESNNMTSSGTQNITVQN